MPKDKSHSKSVTARKRKSEGVKLGALLMGDRGTGKSRYLIELHKINVEKVYKKRHGEDIDWNNVDVEKVEKCAEECLMCVIDFDLEGQEQLLMRTSIMPDEIADTWEKWPVTGSPDNTPLDDYTHRFDDGYDALFYYLKMLRDHHQQYPDGYRVLIIEDMGEVADAVLDHFFYITTKGKVKTFKDQFAQQTRKKQQYGKEASGKEKADAALFPLGQRETFGLINIEYKDFVSNAIRYKREYDYSFYCTTRIGRKMNDETGQLDEWALGKTYLIENYLDVIIKFKKLSKESVKDGKKHLDTVFILTTAEGAKNRLSADFTIKNEGPKSFFAQLEKERAIEDKEILSR